MCNPMAIGLAITAVGAGLQYKANQDRQADMRGLQRRETERQGKLQKESEQSLRDNQQSYEMSNLQTAMDKAAGERQAQYAAAEASAPRTFEAIPGQTGSMNSVVSDAFNRAMAGASADADQRGALNAQLASFGDALGLKAIENNRRTGNIGMIGSFMQGSANVLPLELQHAMTRTRGAEVAGKALSAIGGAISGGAGLGLGAAGAGAAGVAGGVGAGAYGAAGAGLGGVDFSRIFGGG